MQRAAASGTRAAGRGHWLQDRVDFVAEAERCLFCNRPLSSRVARWVVEARGPDGSGERGRNPSYPAGPKCARRHAHQSAGRLPDFTRAAVEFPAEEHDRPANDEPVGGENPEAAAPSPGPAAGESPDTPPRRSPSSPPNDGRQAEYLRLRYEKLRGFSGLGTNDRLDGVYYRTLGSHAPREISGKDLAYVANLVAKLERQSSTLAPANLQACYAYGFWAEEYLKAGFHPTVAGILRSLKENLTLTEKQVEALNAFFAKRSGFPLLDPTAFAGVVRRRPIRSGGARSGGEGRPAQRARKGRPQGPLREGEPR